MKIAIPSLCLALCAASAAGQITQITAASLINPQIMDFDTGGAPGPGAVSPQDPYFVANGLCEVNIVNAPGMHTPAGDTLSSGFIGNCVASVNNTIAIVAPGGAMDNHTAGAGFKFALAPGLTATQFGCIITDQTNHTMSVETWTAGVMQNTFSFTMAGGFPNPYIYFEDLAGFDEVRFQNPTTNGGWGVDDFTLGNVQGTAGSCPPLPPPPYQINSPASALTISGLPDPGILSPIAKTAGINTPETLDLASTNVGLPFDIGLDVGGTTVASFLGTLNSQTVNLNLGSPGLFFLNGGVAPNVSTSSFPAAVIQFPFQFPTPLMVAGQMVVIDLTNPDGFVLSHAVEYAALTCSMTENFVGLTANNGSAASGGPYPIGWADGGGAAQWQVRTGTTSSANTGPLAGAFSPPNYMYCETSSPNFGVNFRLDTCLYDLTQLSTFTLNFRLSRIGATIGTLNVLMDDGSGAFATTLATYTGPEPTSTDWTAESINLTPVLPASGMAAFRFDYTSGTTFTGDIAIDDFDLQ